MFRLTIDSPCEQSQYRTAESVAFTQGAVASTPVMLMRGPLMTALAYVV